MAWIGGNDYLMTISALAIYHVRVDDLNSHDEPFTFAQECSLDLVHQLSISVRVCESGQNLSAKSYLVIHSSPLTTQERTDDILAALNTHSGKLLMFLKVLGSRRINDGFPAQTENRTFQC